MKEFGGDTVWCFLEEEDAGEMLGQSRGTGPIMYLLLERWEKEKNGYDDAWIGGRDSDGCRLKERDWRRQRGQMWRERTGRCRVENREPDSEE